jgi:single-strand DNA-binding protein
MCQNRVHLIGYLGKNPEHKSVKTTDRKYAVLSLATQRSWKGADEEWHSKTEWHRVVALNGLGEYAATKLRKGHHIYVEGTLVSSNLREGVRQRQEQDHRAVQGLAGERGFHPQAQPRQERAGTGQRAARRAA